MAMHGKCYAIHMQNASKFSENAKTSLKKEVANRLVSNYPLCFTYFQHSAQESAHMSFLDFVYNHDFFLFNVNHCSWLQTFIKAKVTN